MTFRNFILLLLLGLSNCDLGYCEFRNVKVYPQFAGISWESSKEEVIEGLRKRGYKRIGLKERKNYTEIISRGTLMGYPVGILSKYDTSGENLGLLTIQVTFILKNLSGLEREAALSRVINVLLAKYGDVSGTQYEKKAIYWTASGYPVLFLIGIDNDDFSLTYCSPNKIKKEFGDPKSSAKKKVSN